MLFNEGRQTAMHRVLVSVGTVALLASAPAAFAEDLQIGKQLYDDNCAVCHGSAGEGQTVAPAGGARAKKLAGDSAYWDFATFRKAVVEGLDDKGRQMKAPMPVFEQTGFLKPKGEKPTDEQIEDIQAYVKTFAPPG